MRGWIPGYVVLEGPEATRVPMRYRGYREGDGAPAWIRVDGHAPNELRAAVAVARVYQETARFDHPDVPAVLGYGSTEIAGRPYIAFQLAEEEWVEEPGPRSLGEAAEVLSELQLLSYELGTGGLHLPRHELDRVRAGVKVHGRRLPLREFLVEPRRSDGISALLGVAKEEEWVQYAAPEMRGGRHRKVSVRQALAYRLAAQLHHVLTGSAPVPDRSSVSVSAALATGRLPDGAVAGFSLDRWQTLAASLVSIPGRRPPMESLLT